MAVIVGCGVLCAMAVAMGLKATVDTEECAYCLDVRALSAECEDADPQLGCRQEDPPTSPLALYCLSFVERLRGTDRHLRRTVRCMSHAAFIGYNFTSVAATAAFDDAATDLELGKLLGGQCAINSPPELMRRCDCPNCSRPQQQQREVQEVMAEIPTKSPDDVDEEKKGEEQGMLPILLKSIRVLRYRRPPPPFPTGSDAVVLGSNAPDNSNSHHHPSTYEGGDEYVDENSQPLDPQQNSTTIAENVFTIPPTTNYSNDETESPSSVPTTFPSPSASTKFSSPQSPPPPLYPSSSPWRRWKEEASGNRSVIQGNTNTFINNSSSSSSSVSRDDDAHGDVGDHRHRSCYTNGAVVARAKIGVFAAAAVLLHCVLHFSI